MDPTDYDFRQSYKDFASYPLNLILPYGNPAALEDYRNRLDHADSILFNYEPKAIAVAFREFDALGIVTKRNVYSSNEVDKWLVDREKIIIDPEVLRSFPLEPNRLREPKCRFIFLLPNHSWDPINVTREIFNRIMSYHQVNPNYINLVLCFGRQKNRQRDFRFGSFRAQSFLVNSPQSLDIPFRGRSGLHFQLSYSLRAIELSSDSNPNSKRSTWERRQIAVHHQFDVVYGTSLWIITSGRDKIKKQIQKLLPEREPDCISPEGTKFTTPAECLKSSLSVHLENCFWAVVEWRWYIQWLEQEIEDLTELSIDSDLVIFSEVELRKLQYYEDSTNEAMMILRSNAEILSSIALFYQNLLGEVHLPWIFECQEAILRFISQIQDMIYDIKMHISRAEVLVKISENRKRLLYQRIQAQGSRETAALSLRMQKVSEDSQKEAVAMRIITVITLIFLPATFVSTLFSTDIIKYDGGKQIFSSLALERWMEVTIPLTVSTLALAATWNYWHSRREIPQKQQLWNSQSARDGLSERMILGGGSKV